MQNKYYRHMRMVGKRLWYNYYLKNWIEYKRNRKLLEKVRENSKDNKNNENPLISVRIPTYNRSKILAERVIPSILRQTYQNFEIIVVGDHCTDNTEELIKNFNDNRIKFFNLPKRGSYPTNPIDRWRVAGTIPANKGLELCTGEFTETRLQQGVYTELRAAYNAYRHLVKGLLDGLFPEFTQVFKDPCGMTALSGLFVHHG